MDNREVERVLNEVAQLLELRGENTFKVRAYQNAARAIAALQEDVTVLVPAGRLKGIKGIGQSIQEKVTQLVESGQLDYLEELRAGIPAGLFDMLKVPGVGPKKTKLLWEQLGVDSLEGLEAACREGRVAELKGFGEKSQEKILDGIAHLALTRGRRLRSQALPQAERLLAHLAAQEGAERVALAGSLRRGRETVKDADILVAAQDPEPVMEAVRTYDQVDGLIGSGPTKTSVRLRDGLQVDVRVVEPGSFACGLAYFTGSKEFNVALRQLALDRGYSLNEYFLRPLDGSEPPRLDDERALLAALGLAYIDPHLRETPDSILAAAEERLPALLEPEDLTGILHVHTTWSDGTATVEQVVQGALDLGYRFVGISDHSQAAEYANGLTPERLERQREEVEAARAKHGKRIRIYHGIEADILPDGSLDMEDALEELDFVIASVHLQLGMERQKMTQRLVRALRHPRVRVFGHPENRMLLEREGSEFDWEAVLDAAAENQVAVEVSGSPKRLDANWVRVRRIRTRGVKLCLNPDAHSVGGLDHARQYAVVEARRGWAEAKDVVNTLPPKRFEREFLRLGG